jgi:hypothetical protein
VHLRQLLADTLCEAGRELHADDLLSLKSISVNVMSRQRVAQPCQGVAGQLRAGCVREMISQDSRRTEIRSAAEEGALQGAALEFM